MAKKLITASAMYTTYDIHDPYGPPVPLVEFIAKLQCIDEELNKIGWQNTRISIAVESDYDSANLNIEITGTRPETDLEEARRVKAEERTRLQKKKLAEAKAKSLKDKEALEIAELARLKAKYE